MLEQNLDVECALPEETLPSAPHFVSFPLTKNQLSAISVRTPAPTPSVPALPSWSIRARPVKPPMKSTTIAMILWSRAGWYPRLNSDGSVMSSHHVVVSTTRGGGQRWCRGVGEKRRTGGGELRVHALAHDPLQAEAHAQERDGHERERVRPHGVAAAVRDALGAALPDRERRGRGEQRLEERAEHEPQARLVPEPVADAPEERAEREGEDGRERELVRVVEGLVAVPGGALEEAREGEGELGDRVSVGWWVELCAHLGTVARLEAAPDEGSRERDRVAN